MYLLLSKMFNIENILIFYSSIGKIFLKCDLFLLTIYYFFYIKVKRKKERNSKSDVIYLNWRMVRKSSLKNFVNKLNWAWSLIFDPYLSQILMNWSSLKNAFIKKFTLWIKSESFFYNQNLKSDQFSSSYKSYQFNI